MLLIHTQKCSLLVVKMTASMEFLNYSGPVDYFKIDLLMRDLKKSLEFKHLNKITGKRVYAIIVECLENIIKYSTESISGDPILSPAISVSKQKNNVVIKASNTIGVSDTGNIILKIDEVNNLCDNALKALFEKNIKKKKNKDDTGSGLGLILIKLKSGNKIIYNISPLDIDHNYLELTISVNEYLS